MTVTRPSKGALSHIKITTPPVHTEDWERQRYGVTTDPVTEMEKGSSK